MRFAFTEDQLLLRDTVRGLLARECPPDVVRSAWEARSGRAPSVWAKLAEAGVTAMTLSEASGGLGMDELDLALVLEEAGYAGLPDPLVETVAVGAPLLEAVGTAAQKERWLDAAAAGDALIAVGFEGQPFVPHAAVAAVALLHRGGDLYAVPREELPLEPQVSVDRSRPIARVDYAPDARHRVDAGDRAALDAAVGVAFDRAAWATSCVLLGLTRRMLDLAVQYAKDREQFGKPIGAQQAIKHHLATALIRQELARPLVYRAAWSLAHRDSVRDHGAHVSMAKVHAANAARHVAKTALQVHGAIGYTIEHDLHLFQKRAWALAAMYGDVGFHRARVGAATLPD